MDDKNYSLYGLPVAIVLAYVPHVVKGAIITKSLGKYNNVNPRSQLEKVQSRMTKASYEMAKRADAAHHNGLEIFPIFAGAVLAGNFAGLPNSTLNKYSAVFLTARFFYNFVYIKNSNSIVAGLRSLIWMVSIVSCFGLYLEAAKGKL
ncbi:uncharacterized protein SPPG_08502 [Spizellomyces punctatus DAOM BR117]|uniref:MAPEG family protein n=1 Tax=Spizellomyces punctatus (strain DAOM BR117) TaxID=645134 RepID=A0A0L0H5Y4_SPIPD|nr:uncharacterized protein SPPG_08502 [Spizellomyces punctatus DAOM BR117]KNC96113.1 hypothetical protein SPPG_08502 [Spizellomyces punctatus DAOM BR117]|eukprot:XP_016604153.1 hypothetical protein SPPG_08502 [Spizellomyces punctatus DAOM BR117]